MRWAFSAGLLLVAPACPLAGEADVLAASARQDARGSWTVSATIAHGDTGWEHYADRFDVLDEAGTLLGTRILLHPHVEEQPFTRTLTGLDIPSAVSRITVQAHDSQHGTGGAGVEIVLER